MARIRFLWHWHKGHLPNVIIFKHRQGFSQIFDLLEMGLGIVSMGITNSKYTQLGYVYKNSQFYTSRIISIRSISLEKKKKPTSQIGTFHTKIDLKKISSSDPVPKKGFRNQVHDFMNLISSLIRKKKCIWSVMGDTPPLTFIKSTEIILGTYRIMDTRPPPTYLGI